MRVGDHHRIVELFALPHFESAVHQEVGEDIRHVAAEQIGGGGAHLAGQIRGADDGHTAVSHLRSYLRALHVAAQLAGRAIDNDTAAVQTTHTGLGEQHGVYGREPWRW